MGWGEHPSTRHVPTERSESKGLGVGCAGKRLPAAYMQEEAWFRQTRIKFEVDVTRDVRGGRLDGSAVAGGGGRAGLMSTCRAVMRGEGAC